MLTRLRQDPTDTTRLDEEESIVRSVVVPTDREFRVVGDARLFRRNPPRGLDEVLGRPHDGSVTWVRASSRLNGSVDTAAAAFDGDPTTAWTTVRSDPDRQWVEVNLTEPVTVDSVPLTVVADGLHSVPTEVEVLVDGVSAGRIPLPEVVDDETQGATSTVDVPLPESVTGSTFRVRLTGIRPVVTNDWVSDDEVDQPAAIAEIGLPGEPVPALPETFDSGCRDDLVTIDGLPLPVRVTGPMSTRSPATRCR